MSGRISARARKASAAGSCPTPVPPPQQPPADCKCDLSAEIQAVRDALDDLEEAQADCAGGPAPAPTCTSDYKAETKYLRPPVAGSRLLAPPATCAGCEGKYVRYGGATGDAAGAWRFKRAGTATYTLSFAAPPGTLVPFTARLEVLDGAGLPADGADFKFRYVDEQKRFEATATVQVSAGDVAGVLLRPRVAGGEVLLPAGSTLRLAFRELILTDDEDTA